MLFINFSFCFKKGSGIQVSSSTVSCLSHKGYKCHNIHKSSTRLSYADKNTTFLNAIITTWGFRKVNTASQHELHQSSLKKMLCTVLDSIVLVVCFEEQLLWHDSWALREEGREGGDDQNPYNDVIAKLYGHTWIVHLGGKGRERKAKEDGKESLLSLCFPAFRCPYQINDVAVSSFKLLCFLGPQQQLRRNTLQGLFYKGVLTPPPPPSKLNFGGAEFRRGTN